MARAAGHADDEVREPLDVGATELSSRRIGRNPSVALRTRPRPLTTAALDPAGPHKASAAATVAGTGRNRPPPRARSSGPHGSMPRSGPERPGSRGKRPPRMLAPGKFPQYLTELRTKTLLGVASELLGQLSDDEFGFAADLQIITRRNGATRSPGPYPAERPSSPPWP